MIKVKDLKYSVDEAGNQRTVLDISECYFEDNEINVIAGPSGSGKTSLLYALGGLLDIKPHSVYSNECDVYKLNPAQRDLFRLNNVSMIYQNYNLFDFMDVTDNIIIPMLLNDKQITNEIYSDIEHFFNKMNLGDIGRKTINSLSGGEQQRVAIIRSLICKPKIILCDEPTASLDSENTKIFMDTLNLLKKEYSCTIIISSHDEQVIKYADKLFSLKDGRIVK